MRRIDLRLDAEDLIPLLLGGFAGAVWMLVIDANVAHADNCLSYVEKVSNFVAIPKDLLEDCFRTASVQAIITAIMGGMGGAAIAAAITKALKEGGKKENESPGPKTPDYKDEPKKDNPWDPSDEEKKKKWKDDKVVWDPNLLGWRRPKPDEIPPADEGPKREGPTNDVIKQQWEKNKLIWDKDKKIWRKLNWDESPPPGFPPEDTPYQRSNPRLKTPPECLEKYDAYANTQKRMLELEPEIEKNALDLRLTQDWLQLKLGIFTAQFAIDMSDFMQLGGAAVRSAGPISQAIGSMGSVSSMARAAAKKVASLGATLMELLRELAELGLRARSLRTAAEALAESARVLTRYADEAAEALLALDKRVAANRQLMALAADIEPLKAKRAAVLSTLLDAEQRMRAAEQLWQRKQQLQRLMDSERATIPADQARLAVAAQAELEAVEEEIRTLQSRIAQSPELKNAQVRSSRATTERARIDNRIRELESESKRLAESLEAIEKKITQGKAQLAKAAQIEQEISELEGFKAAVEDQRKVVAQVKEELKEFESGSEFSEYKAERQRLRAELDEALKAQNTAQIRLETAGKAEIQFAEDLANELELAGFDRAANDVDLLPPAKAAEMKARYRAIDDEFTNAKNGVRDAKAEVSNARARSTEGIKNLDAEEAALVEKGKTLAAEVASQELELKGVENRLTKAAEINNVDQYDMRVADLREDIQNLKEEGQAALERDPLSKPAFEQALETAQQELPIRRTELTAADREFDDATNIENNVRSQMEGTEREALNARKAQAQAKLKQANRGWQEVAAEKNPGDFQQWKLEVEGTDPIRDGDAQLEPIRREVVDGRKAEKEAENEIEAWRDKMGSDTSESIQRKLADDEMSLRQKQQEHAAAVTKAGAEKRQADDADREAKDAEARHAAKEAEVSDVQSKKAQAEADAGGAGADDGLDTIDSIAKRSKELSNQYKPGWATGTENALKSAFSTFGEKWTKYFNGQSPDEVAQGLKKSRDKVIRLKEELDARKAEWDTLRIQLPIQKGALDSCMNQYDYWKGPAEE
jgi:hypothetical protein